MLALASSQPTGSSSGSAPLRRSAGGTVPDGVGVGEFLSVGAAGRRGDRPRRGSGSSARGLGMVTGEGGPANAVVCRSACSLGGSGPRTQRLYRLKLTIEIIFSHAGNAGPVIKDDDAFAGLLLIEFLVRVSNLVEPPPMAVQVIDRKPVA